jgi:hypothetical protein
MRARLASLAPLTPQSLGNLLAALGSAQRSKKPRVARASERATNGVQPSTNMKDTEYIGMWMEKVLYRRVLWRFYWMQTKIDWTPVGTVRLCGRLYFMHGKPKCYRTFITDKITYED